MEIVIEVTQKDVGRCLDKIAYELDKACVKAIHAAAEKLKELSLKLVPRDTETLAHSARVTLEESSVLFNSEAFVGYGGSDLPAETNQSTKTGKMITRKASQYALFVHEDFTVAHDGETTHGYLINPVLLNKDELNLAFREEFWRAFRG